MGRVLSVSSFVGLVFVVVSLAGCGKKSSGISPNSVRLAPTTLSLEQGKYSGLSVTDGNGGGIPVGRITWQATGGGVLSVGILNGTPTVCAGTWDSLTAPTVCTPGPAQVSQLTASANGATSAPITVFVHSHIERLEAQLITTPPVVCGASGIPGVSATSQFAAAGSLDYQVIATNNGNDITATIGPITWSSGNSTVVSLLTSGSGLLSNQVRATAKTPGQTSLTASAGGTSSNPVVFTTCPVTNITLATAANTNSLVFPKGTAAQTITATVTDAAGLTLINPPLTWSVANPTVATVSAAGVVAGVQSGATAVTASCLPATCNIGFLPASAPVYPPIGVGVTVQGTSSSTTVYAASSGCWDRSIDGPVLGCLSYIIPIPQSTNIPGSPIALPHTPTSMRMSASGTETYVGSCVPRTPGGQPVCNGIAVVSSAGAVSSNNSVTGDVIGVSLSGNKAVISDTSTTPNQVFLYDQPSNSGTQLLLPTSDHAKSAVFSSDTFQVYITTYQCTASPCQLSNEVAGPVYVFDAINQLHRLSAPTGVTDVAFHPSGAFAFMAQAANAVTAVNTSTNTVSGSPLSLPGSPEFILALNDWDETSKSTRFFALNGPLAPDGEIITATSCGTFSLCNTTSPLIDFNQGPMDAAQFLLSTDGVIALVVPKNFASVFSYNLVTKDRTGISLTGAQPATTGGLTTDGTTVYVGSKDGFVHVLKTASLSDTLEISPVTTTTNPSTGMCSISSTTQPCNPDFVVVKP